MEIQSRIFSGVRSFHYPECNSNIPSYQQSDNLKAHKLLMPKKLSTLIETWYR